MKFGSGPGAALFTDVASATFRRSPSLLPVVSIPYFDHRTKQLYLSMQALVIFRTAGGGTEENVIKGAVEGGTTSRQKNGDARKQRDDWMTRAGKKQ